MPQHVFMGLCAIGTGFLFIAMNLPFALGRVRPNRFYCIPAAAFFRANEEAWYDISRYGGRQAILWTIPLFILGVLLLLLPIDPWLTNKWTNLTLAAGPPTLAYNIPFIITSLYAWRKRKGASLPT